MRNLKRNTVKYLVYFNYICIQDIPEENINILEGDSIDYFKQKCSYERLSYEHFCLILALLLLN